MARSQKSSLQSRLDLSPASRRVAYGGQLLFLLFICATFGFELGWGLFAVVFAGTVLSLLGLAYLYPRFDAHRRRERDGSWALSCLASLVVPGRGRDGGRIYFGDEMLRWVPRKSRGAGLPMFEVAYSAVRRVEIMAKPMHGCVVYVDADEIGPFKLVTTADSARVRSVLHDAAIEVAGPIARH